MELDSVSDFVDLREDLFALSQSDGELAQLDQDVSEELGDLLGNGVGGQKDIVLLAPFFNFSLVLVEGLKSINVNEGNIVGSAFLDVDGVGHDTDSDFVIGDMGKSDGSVESFVWIVVSHTDLEFDCFEELSLLFLGQKVVDGLLQEVCIDLTHL